MCFSFVFKCLICYFFASLFLFTANYMQYDNQIGKRYSIIFKMNLIYMRDGDESVDARRAYVCHTHTYKERERERYAYYA